MATMTKKIMRQIGRATAGWLANGGQVFVDGVNVKTCVGNATEKVKTQFKGRNNEVMMRRRRSAGAAMPLS
jgi:hypothetical protein